MIHPKDGEPWALLYYGFMIYPEGTQMPDDRLVAWDDGRMEGNMDAFGRAFEGELRKAGFNAADAEGSLFADNGGTTDLQIGVLIDDIKGRFCGNCPNLFQKDKVAAVVSMHARWEVYSAVRGGVVAKITTEGGAAWRQKIEGSSLPVILEAFRENTRQLLASQEFRNVVLQSAYSAPPAPRIAEMILKLPPAIKGVPLSEASKAVVSIFAGDGMGSGVLVSPEGYILTNHHVVGDSGQVRVRWPDGTEGVGEVVRADRKRDVALIRTAPRAQPIAIRHTPAVLGETVFAIGTPLDKRLAGTVTRGVVSTSNRVLEGQPFIQSDVGVTHGNSGGPLLDEKGAVIGLTVIGLYPDESKSLNLFIPIEDALRALALRPAS